MRGRTGREHKPLKGWQARSIEPAAEPLERRRRGAAVGVRRVPAAARRGRGRRGREGCAGSTSSCAASSAAASASSSSRSSRTAPCTEPRSCRDASSG
nr:hypothetical protein [Angustibacter aerolatus]